MNSWLGWTTYDINNTAAPEANQPSVPTIGESPVLAANVGTAEPTASDENKPAGDWLPLGVFALEPPTEGGEQLVQLALRRDGTLEGVAYSKGTDESSNLVGEVDRETNKAYWKVDANQKVVVRGAAEDAHQRRRAGRSDARRRRERNMDFCPAQAADGVDCNSKPLALAVDGC